MSLKRFLLALCLGTISIQLGLQCARAEPPYQVALEDEFGNVLPTYAHHGEWFALGREGQRYNVRIFNHTGQRVEAVVSVDGRDVLSGMPGNYKQQRGYLVPAYGSVLIDGFRTSLSSVAAFRFTHPGDSYSSRMGTPENVGVVGAAFFPEAAPPTIPRRPPSAVQPEPYSEYHPPARRDAHAENLGTQGSEPSASSPAPSERRRATRGAGSAPKSSSAIESGNSLAWADEYDDSSSNIGTQYGETTHSQVNEVSFTRARPSSPERVLTLRYDNRAGLVARGVLPRPRPRRYEGPEAFPVNRFAPPPPARPHWY
jgi:hypothetical protein